MKKTGRNVERAFGFAARAFAFSVLFLYCSAVWLVNRFTGCDYMGDGTFKCRRCGWRGRGPEMASVSVGTVCPVCAKRKKKEKGKK